MLSVSEWAELHRWLSAESSAEPFRWRNARTPYLVAIMDDLTPANPTQTVVFMKGSQVGATECGNNWLGYVIHHAPAPMLMIRPNVQDAKDASKQRLAPMIRDCAVLRERVKEPRSRDSGNTLLMKEFPGGHLTLAGANSTAGLKSKPIRFLFPDEIDEYEGDVDGQGDPIDIATKRTLTYGSRRKSFLVSTPTIKGMSRIEKSYLASDRRRYLLPCPRCGHPDYLTWDGPDRVCGGPVIHHRIKWDEGEPETARMVCSGCDAEVPESEKTRMLERGQWKATAIGNGSHGYHLSGLYSPWNTWGACASEFLEVKHDPFRLRVWVNQILGETFEERGDSVDPESILGRLEEYPAEVPDGVGILVAATDVQDDRLETVVLGFGAGEECWVIEHQVFRGDTGSLGPYAQLDRFLKGLWRHQSGQLMPIQIATVDANFRTEEVYRFCKVRARRQVYAVRGGREHGKPIVQHVSVDKRLRVKIYTLCTDTAKDVIFARLRIQPPKQGAAAPGLIHFPISWREGTGGVDQVFVDQLASERAIWEWDRRRGPRRVWDKQQERNEILDCFVYAWGGLHIGGAMLIRDLGRRARRWAIRVKNPKPVPTRIDPGSAPAAPAPPAIDDAKRRDALLDQARRNVRGRSRRGGWIRRPLE